MFWKVAIWYTALVISIAFPPLFIITAVPLLLTADAVRRVLKQHRALRRVQRYHVEQAAYYAEARKLRGYLS